MSNPIAASASAATTTTTGTAAGSAAQATAASATASTPSVTAKAKAQLNASIVQASLTVSLNSSDEPMALVLKTALTGINEALKDQFGENAIQNAASQDNTPAGTAGRIVSLSTAFYGAFQQQHKGEAPDAVLQKFMDTLQSGVDQGFAEARGILDGLKVLNGDVAANIDQTYQLVQQGYADFAASQRSSAKPAATPASGTGA